MTLAVLLSISGIVAPTGAPIQCGITDGKELPLSLMYSPLTEDTMSLGILLKWEPLHTKPNLLIHHYFSKLQLCHEPYFIFHIHVIKIMATCITITNEV